MALFDLVLPSWLRRSVDGVSKSLDDHRVSIDDHAAALDRNTAAIEAASAPDPATLFDFNFTIGPTTMKRDSREGVTLKVLISDEQKITLTMNPKTQAGHPAAVENPAWVSLDPSIVTAEPSEDGLSCNLVSQGVGTTKIQVAADADLGEGVRTINTEFDFEVAAAEASDLGLSAGEPELK